uniref:Uncharacterized protein n=1 Tax=viral metagenome TaxID=1070528 RepID=A0A6M3K2P2_9ZZZZ
MSQTAPGTEKKAKPRSEADLRFETDSKIQPKGFSNLEINEDVTITLTGKIKSLSMHEYREGDGSKSLLVELKSCTIGKGDAKSTGVGYQSDKD